MTNLASEPLLADLERARKLAMLMDAQFEVMGVKFGYDAIVGLVPVLGDVATAIVGAYPIFIAKKHGLERGVQARMAANLLVDWAIGAVPLLGDVFDVALKANIRNLRLLEKAVEKRQRGPGGFFQRPE